MYKISVGICCYKQKHFLHRCLKSLSNQTFNKDDFEIIVVNDDPTERIDDVIDNWKSHLNITLINNIRNIGLPSSLNEILKRCKGSSFVRVDADDYVSEHFLYILNFILVEKREKYQAITCDYKKVDAIGRVIGKFSAEKDFIACGILFDYEAICDINFYNEDFKMREGHEMMKRFKEKYYIYHSNLCLYRYRSHDENRTIHKEELKLYDNKIGG